jgi:hypothetical protein
MSTYEPLQKFLLGQPVDQVPMTFDEIEKLLGRSLPASKQYPAWWSNNPSNNPMTREWLSAGFQTESVNIASGKLVFRRVRKPSPAAQQPSLKKEKGFPFGFMKGMLTIAPGYDVAAPLDVEWGEPYLGIEEAK